MCRISTREGCFNIARRDIYVPMNMCYRISVLQKVALSERKPYWLKGVACSIILFMYFRLLFVAVIVFHSLS
jgi:hypothetical protein